MAKRGMNECTIMGTMGKDAELNIVNDNFNVIRLSLAVSEKWKDKQTGEDKEKTEWIPVEIHNRKGLVDHLKKGTQLLVRGSFSTRKYEKDGVTHYASSVVVGMYGDVQFCGGKPQSSGGGQPQGGNQFSGGAQSRPQQQSNEPPMDFDDDIPFAPIGLPFPRHSIYAL